MPASMPRDIVLPQSLGVGSALFLADQREVDLDDVGDFEQFVTIGARVAVVQGDQLARLPEAVAAGDDFVVRCDIS